MGVGAVLGGFLAMMAPLLASRAVAAIMVLLGVVDGLLIYR